MNDPIVFRNRLQGCEKLIGSGGSGTPRAMWQKFSGHPVALLDTARLSADYWRRYRSFACDVKGIFLAERAIAPGGGENKTVLDAARQHPESR
jgi:hypothetical protein